MRFRYFNIALPALLALAACSDDDGLTSGNGQGEVRITTHISGAQTRAPQLGIDGSGNFEKGDALNLVVYGKEATPYTPDYLVETTTLYWEDIKNATGLNGFYTFAGWYSEDKTLKLQDNNSFSFNVAEAATDEQKDLLLATPTEVNEGNPVNMIFRHAMHKLVVNLSYGEGFDNVDKSAITVKPVGMNAAATIDVKAGTVTVGEASATKGDYDAKTLSNNSCSFILAPQKLQVGSEWLQIQVTEGQTISFHVPEQIVDGNTAVSLTQLNSGETLTLNLTIKRTNIKDIAIELTGCTISGWTDINYNENIPMPNLDNVQFYDLSDVDEIRTAYTITGDGTYYFYGNPEDTVNVINNQQAIVLRNFTGTIILNNLNLFGGNGNRQNLIEVLDGANVTIQVNGNNSLLLFPNRKNGLSAHRGVYVEEGSSVTIAGNSRADVLTTDGIGGYSTNEFVSNCGNINIKNVTVCAYGFFHTNSSLSPGIGGAQDGKCGDITIDDATVYAYGYYGFQHGCPGIGSGYHYLRNQMGTHGTITIKNWSDVYVQRGRDYSDYIGYSGTVDNPASGGIVADVDETCTITKLN